MDIKERRHRDNDRTARVCHRREPERQQRRAAGATEATGVRHKKATEVTERAETWRAEFGIQEGPSILNALVEQAGCTGEWTRDQKSAVLKREVAGPLLMNSTLPNRVFDPLAV
ncbi:UNVERIFIED_CONTAM: hypothetical protein FKN15_013178 [Acipenser sinensis]